MGMSKAIGIVWGVVPLHLHAAMEVMPLSQDQEQTLQALCLPHVLSNAILGLLFRTIFVSSLPA